MMNFESGEILKITYRCPKCAAKGEFTVSKDDHKNGKKDFKCRACGFENSLLIADPKNEMN